MNHSRKVTSRIKLAVILMLEDQWSASLGHNGRNAVVGGEVGSLVLWYSGPVSGRLKKPVYGPPSLCPMSAVPDTVLRSNLALRSCTS